MDKTRQNKGKMLIYFNQDPKDLSKTKLSKYDTFCLIYPRIGLINRFYNWRDGRVAECGGLENH